MDWFGMTTAESAAEVSHCLHQMTSGPLLHRTLVDKVGKKWVEAHTLWGRRCTCINSACLEGQMCPSNVSQA